MVTNGISQYERELLLAHILGVPREYILMHPDFKLTRFQSKKLEGFTKRREQNEPLAYILDRREFYGLDFKVDRSTLIPRPETELLVEATLKKIDSLKEKISLIDIGTGSGNIVISIASVLKRKRDGMTNFYGSDISSGALRVAKHNAKKNKVTDRIRFIKSDILEYFLKHASLLSEHCIIVANLPYLSKNIYAKMMPDVKNFEPRSALLSRQDGLAHYATLFKQIRFLKKSLPERHFSCLIEISPEQKKKVTELVKKHFPEVKPSFGKDLAQKWRLCSFDL